VIGAPGALDAYYAWHRVREIDEAGALLVRPDGVVAWRHAGAPGDAAAAQTLLSRALARVLDRG
jgi:2,4-dichlorophenol 6-monooxygenase